MASFLRLCQGCSATVRFPTAEIPERIFCDACEARIKDNATPKVRAKKASRQRR